MEADGRPPADPSTAAKSATVRLEEAVAAVDAPSAVPKQRRRRRRKARSRALKGCDGEPLPEYFVSDHPRHKWLFQLSEVQLQIPADALLEQLKAGRVAKERRGGVTSMKRARRPIPPREPPPSSTAPAHARRTGPPGVEAMLAHAMAALPPAIKPLHNHVNENIA